MQFNTDSFFAVTSDEAYFKAAEKLPHVTTCKIDSNIISVNIDHSYGSAMIIEIKMIDMQSPQSSIATWELTA